ncbi:MAG: hypothetical protein A2268_03020 [Candidatus Raymondbacteria bacterium RifOxyA12_full_50_37]|uniref:Uncharacterized protein n=1 Tax=Candidatus Raymondbacteria bacterium RIFOXYD12_FULL_49_13 TaxID=1817890 RepID=A0A1F7F8X0_UNCRA|nr:MAG: hypothetical protein A2248_17125 [Candidatus Raymondbacteria bacterium RIFOXYA2_FULL_49_16]OGJ90749.1 MAG: hypothetical protein A2268_03020 [Candidatus Raymondbacteria bacterium RifOxyA12_full_50_37]OGJ92941.1 MAG: hypothetical protein A2350_04885 [Candidatus Raymondbacteria bacterium RifOxyB12_full_50_8]OGJ98386.1 MAG: hypothetical protein A2453_09030 [Candidatus Raymondbacteria bacterium RIFOXYC2_FULL_50_21]OGK03110.1 MAG: hypothetical protein A2519_06865 [Candidatus Raymondbacteria b
MRKSIFILVILTSIVFPEQNTLAVSELDAKGITKDDAQILTDKLRSGLVQTSGYTVLERGKMDEILKEQGFQQSGACSESDCFVQMGQILGVTHMVTGSIGKIGGMYSINVRLIAVSTGKIVRDVTEEYKGNIEDLLGTEMNVVVKKLMGLKVEEKKNHTWMWITAGMVGIAGAGTAYYFLSSDKGSSSGTPEKQTFDLDVSW